MAHHFWRKKSFHLTFASLVISSLVAGCADGGPTAGRVNHGENQGEGEELEAPNTKGGRNPADDSKFAELPQGRNLHNISVSGVRLTFSKGQGLNFGSSQAEAYRKLKLDSMGNPNHPVQWSFMNLDTGKTLAQSAGAQRKIFGASTSKIFVAGALLDKQKGQLDNSQIQLMADMLVVSSNSAWTTLQRQIGNGDPDRGREGVHAFTQRMGYQRTRGFQGWWGSLHGNELTAAETTRFLYDTYQQNYPGADILWKMLHTVRTGANRGRKYISSSTFVGGKTGTYDGPTVDPETGKSTNPDGSAYKVRVRNHALVFTVNGMQYGLVVLADSGSDESAALLAQGLIREI